MPAKKSTKTADESAAPDANQQSTDWAQTVLNRLVEAQKLWLEITSQQNELVVKTVSQVMELTQGAPTDALAEWAKQGIGNFVEAQQRWAEITQQQSAELVKAVQSGSSFSGAAKPMNQSLERLNDLRSAWLNFAAQQNSQLIKAMKENLKIDDSSPAAALADFAEQTLTNYIEVQKRWFDLALQLPFLGESNEPRK